MANSREPTAHKTSSYRILTGLDDREERGSKLGDVPFKLTEERFRVERDRRALPPDWDSVPLAVERPAAVQAPHDDVWAVTSELPRPAGGRASPIRSEPVSAEPYGSVRTHRGSRSKLALASSADVASIMGGCDCTYPRARRSSYLQLHGSPAKRRHRLPTSGCSHVWQVARRGSGRSIGPPGVRAEQVLQGSKCARGPSASGAGS